MFVIRDILTCKPGRAKDLVNIFKNVSPHMEGLGMHKPRIMTDAVSTFWTVVLEFEVDQPGDYWNALDKMKDRPEIGEAMKNYMDCMVGGRREMFKVE